MKIKTILFDLDDTLLGNKMETFLPRYFDLLGQYAHSLFPNSKRLMQELMIGTQAMIASRDATLTNREVFWKGFSERTGLKSEETERFFNRFYDEAFLELQAVTEVRPSAVDLMQTCLERDIEVVIATNPLFPLRAIEHRLAWAGLSVENFDFALVTSYDNMHAAKPERAYYREILERVETEPERALMVGNDWENDIEPAAAVGMRVYWITPRPESAPEPALLTGSGTLEAFHQWLMAEIDSTLEA
ncbi:MAG: HAD family hydrolase [Candidatus Promineifilaceae bacterium]|nr:HAD family hydrolase [Candidatus Promineifilaceae bacterium]